MTLFQRIANKEFTAEESDLIARVCHLAKTTVDGAMAETFLYLPEQYRIRRAESVIFRENINSNGSLNLSFFLTPWFRFFAAFRDINHRAQRDTYLNGEITSEYQWPTSFPHCTPALRMYFSERRENNRETTLVSYYGIFREVCQSVDRRRITSENSRKMSYFDRTTEFR